MAEVSYDVPVGLPDASLLLSAAEHLVALRNVDEREEAVQTCFKLVDAVLVAPADAKKRRLRKANETFYRKVGRHEAALNFLRCVGFQDSDDPDVPGKDGKGALLLMPVAYISRLTDAHHALAQASRVAGLSAPPLPAGSFNPYQATSQRVDCAAPGVTTATEAWRNQADRLQEEVKRREHELKERLEKVAPVPLRPTAFWLSAGRRLEDVVRETAELPSEDVADAALLQSALISAKAASSNGNGNFESAAKNRLAQLSRTRIHEICVLRVICPDKSVLQVRFRAIDTGEHVLAELGPLLASHVRSAGWYLYQSPPLRRLQPKETLAAAGLAPGASLRLGFESGADARPSPPYLAPNVLAQLGPRPQGEAEDQGTSTSPTGSGGHRLGTNASTALAPRTTSFREDSRAATGNPKWFRAAVPLPAQEQARHGADSTQMQPVAAKKNGSGSSAASTESTRSGGSGSDPSAVAPGFALQDTSEVKPRGGFQSFFPFCCSVEISSRH